MHFLVIRVLVLELQTILKTSNTDISGKWAPLCFLLKIKRKPNYCGINKLILLLSSSAAYFNSSHVFLIETFQKYLPGFNNVITYL